MKLLSRYIIKEHIPPFIMAIATLVFVLLANFLLRTMDKFIGKGLNISILIEYVFLNLAWVLALAVPMAVLVSTLMAYGRLSEDNEIIAIKTSGINNISLILPAFIFGLIITIFMTIFNNLILPEMNHKARLLSRDISKKRPDLEFEIGYFINSLPEHTILLGGRNENQFTDIKIFNNQNINIHRTIIANYGTIETVTDGILLHLNDGEIHEYNPKNNEYRQIDYSKYDVFISIDNLNMQRRSSKTRGDREMNYRMIKDKIKIYNSKILDIENRINSKLTNELRISNIDDFNQINIENELNIIKNFMIDSLGNDNHKLISKIKRKYRNLNRGIKNDYNLINTYNKYINKYLVELYKKFSIPFASLIFILIGAPMGIMAKRGGFTISIALSLGIFVIYWIFLIGGEELADRGLLSPFIAMWQPNIFLGILGTFLFIFTSKKIEGLNFNLSNYFFKKKRKISDS